MPHNLLRKNGLLQLAVTASNIDVKSKSLRFVLGCKRFKLSKANCAKPKGALPGTSVKEGFKSYQTQMCQKRRSRYFQTVSFICLKQGLSILSVTHQSMIGSYSTAHLKKCCAWNCSTAGHISRQLNGDNTR